MSPYLLAFQNLHTALTIASTSLGFARYIFVQHTVDIPKQTPIPIFVVKTIVSHDYGLTWRESNDNFGSCRGEAGGALSQVDIKFSGDGNIGVAAKTNGYLYYTSNSGDDWFAQFEPGIQYWTSVAVSTDGLGLYAAFSTDALNTGIYISKDGALSWQAVSHFQTGAFRDGFNIASIAVSCVTGL